MSLPTTKKITCWVQDDPPRELPIYVGRNHLSDMSGEDSQHILLCSICLQPRAGTVA